MLLCSMSGSFNYVVKAKEHVKAIFLTFFAASLMRAGGTRVSGLE